MLLKYLDSQEKTLSRKLWEAVFQDDTKEFLDYYYTYKTKDNQIMVLKGEEEGFRAMLQRNPFLWNLKGEQKVLDYIIAVATDQQYRHQGYMRKLLEKLFLDSYQEEIPFTYLMPAHPDIYRPFQFAYVYDQKAISITKELVERIQEEALAEEATKEISLRQFREEDATLLANFYRDQMEDYQIDYYPVHDVNYYDRQWKEQLSEGGDILLCHLKEELVGYFYYAGEGNWEIREPLFKKERWSSFLGILHDFLQKTSLEKEGKIFIPDSIYSKIGDVFEKIEVINQPIIMIRIVNLKKMLELFSLKKKDSLEPIKVTIKVTDPMIEENNGIFEWTVKNNESEIIKKSEEKFDIEFSVEELTEYLFGYFEVGENSTRKNFQEQEKKKSFFQKIDYFKNSHITELV